MAPNSSHDGGRLTRLQDARYKHAAAAENASQTRHGRPAVPVAAVFEAPDWMKSYGMPVAISCAVGYSLVGLVMVEPTAPEAMFHPAAVLTLLLFALGFVKGMQWWTTAHESGKALTCPHCGLRTRLEALALSSTAHTCRCGQDYSTST